MMYNSIEREIPLWSLFFVKNVNGCESLFASFTGFLA